MELTATCPECGTPIAATLEGSLKFAPEMYLRKLLRATRFITIGMATYVLGLVAVAVFATIMSGGMSVLSNPTSGNVGGGAMLLTILISAPVVMMLLGFWLFTSLHPGLPEAKQAKTSAVLTRVAVGISAVACITSSVGAVVAATQTGNTANALASMSAVMSCGSCGAVPLLLGLLLPPLGIVRWLAAQDATDESRLLSVRAKRLYWLLPVLVVASPLLGYGVFVFGLIGAGLAAGATSNSPPDTAIAITFAVGCGVPIVCIVTAMVLIWHVFFKTREILVARLKEREGA